MNESLKEMIAPKWIKEQQGVYVPLIDKVLLKDNVPSMPYNDFMRYAKDNNVQIATKEELLQMYLQKEEINSILKEHNGDLLNDWFGSSSEYSSYEWFVNFGSGNCLTTYKTYSNLSRAVVALRENKEVKKGVEGNSLYKCKPIDWEQRRYEIAKDALVGLLAAPGRTNVISRAVEFADALVEELKK